METRYSIEPRDVDQPVRDADAERKPGESIRVRVHPSLYSRTSGQHKAWSGVSWTIDCSTAAEAIALREALRAFFAAVGRLGPDVLGPALDGLQAPEHAATG